MKTEDTYLKDVQAAMVREQHREIRRKFLTYAQAEIVYSLSHKKLLELATDAGAIYRQGVTVLINKEIFDNYFERFHEISAETEVP